MTLKLSNFLAWVFTLWLLLPTSLAKDDPQVTTRDAPVNFPAGIKIEFSSYENWYGDIKTDVWITYPKNADQVVELANWARNASYRLRPSGYRSSWAPLTIDPQNPGNVVVVDTTKALTTMGIVSSDQNNASFWAESGTSLISILAGLEKVNLTLASFPARGAISVGGALACGAHGIGIRTRAEGKPQGNTFGSISNLVVQFTAVVYDPIVDAYVQKTFHRSDPEAKAFLVNFGRTFITNVTLRAGPLVNIHAVADFQHPPEKLFALSDDSETLAELWKRYRVELFYVPAVNLAWVFKYKPSAEKPAESRSVSSPNNFKIGLLAFKLKEVVNIWGTPKNTLFYYHNPRSAKVTDGSWVIVTSRGNMQNVLHNTHRIFEQVSHRYESDTAPLYWMMRVGEVDNPNDVGIEGAESPAMGEYHPVEGRPDLDVGIACGIGAVGDLTEHQRQRLLALCEEIEKLLMEHFNDDTAYLRVDWSKSYAFDPTGAYSKEPLRKIKERGRFGPFKYSAGVLTKYDPLRIFTSSLTDMLLE